MREFVSCMKKEFLELIRGKKLIVFIGLALGFVAMNIGLIYLLNGLMNAVAEDAMGLGNMLMLSNGVGMYNSYVQVYYVVPCLFMIMGTVAKEIKKKKWVLPVSCGVKPQNMVAAKFVVLLSAIVLPLIVGFLFNTFLGFLLFEHNVELSDVMLSGVGLVVYTLFYSTMCIAMSAITKNSALAVLIPLGTMLIAEPILNVLKVGAYTPALFTSLISNLPMMGMSAGIAPTAAQWVSASLITAGCIAVLVFFAVNNRKLSVV